MTTQIATQTTPTSSEQTNNLIERAKPIHAEHGAEIKRLADLWKHIAQSYKDHEDLMPPSTNRFMRHTADRMRVLSKSLEAIATGTPAAANVALATLREKGVDGFRAMCTDFDSYTEAGTERQADGISRASGNAHTHIQVLIDQTRTVLFGKDKSLSQPAVDGSLDLDGVAEKLMEARIVPDIRNVGIGRC